MAAKKPGGGVFEGFQLRKPKIPHQVGHADDQNGDFSKIPGFGLEVSKISTKRPGVTEIESTESY